MTSSHPRGGYGPPRGTLLFAAVLAVLGTIGVAYVASYIETLTELGRNDREAAAALFRTRVLPVLWVVSLLALTAGVVMARQGVRLLRSSIGDRRDPPVPPSTSGQAVGLVFAVAGIGMMVLPLFGVAYLTWLVW